MVKSKWNDPKLFQLGVENTEAATFDSKTHDGVWVSAYDENGNPIPIEKHS